MGINIIFSVVAQPPLYIYVSHTSLGQCIFVTMSSLVPSPPANTPPVPRDNPSPPRLRTLSAPTTIPPRPILRLIVVSLLPHPPSVVVLSSPSPHPGRLLIVVSPTIAQCRCPRTMRCCLPLTQTAVAFVEPQSPLSCLPSPAIVVRCCRRSSTLPSPKDAAVVVGRYYRMPSSAAVVGCCGQGCWCQQSPYFHKTHSATPPASFKTPS